MRRACLLVADRNPRFLEKTAEILGECGHAMVGVTDGNDARLRLGRELDGVLAHTSLPGLSGFALCRLVKERDPTLPVVLMFSAEDPSGEVEAARAGADNWLVRPLKRTELLYVVRDLVGMRGRFVRAQRTSDELEQARRVAHAAQAPDAARLVQFDMFKRLLGIEIKRSQRYGFPLSMLLASLDQAPQPGDRELLASAAKAAIRDIDIPVAFAESAILVVMPHTDLDGGTRVAERIRRRVQAGAAPGTTASIGVVSTRIGERVNFSTLLAQATRAQKAAARAGGDRVLPA
jgi:PleD family two-component response regulator